MDIMEKRKKDNIVCRFYRITDAEVNGELREDKIINR